MNIFEEKKNGIHNKWKMIGKTLNTNKDESQNTINRHLIDEKNLAERLAKPRITFRNYLKEPKNNRFTITP